MTARVRRALRRAEIVANRFFVLSSDPYLPYLGASRSPRSLRSSR